MRDDITDYNSLWVQHSYDFKHSTILEICFRKTAWTVCHVTDAKRLALLLMKMTDAFVSISTYTILQHIYRCILRNPRVCL